MTERETTRLIAWSNELRDVHARLREALRVSREAVTAGTHDESATQELLLFCRGFCAALAAHHRGEDRTLFPAVADAHPELGPVLRSLEQDHSVIGNLLGALGAAVDGEAAPDEIERHLDGLAAIMESHFRYEERALSTVLDTLELSVQPPEALGPL